MVDADTRHPVPIGNRWDLLDAPELGRWTPTARLSVVIPHYQAVGALERTLASLAAQTYPKDLLEVVVVDDGSDPPLELPDAAGAAWSGLEVRVLHQEDLGFGLARARHNGALAATGSILVFLDADMLCEPRHLEAHARWHHLTDLAVTLGERQHVPADEDHPLPPAEAVRAAAEAGGLETLLGTLPRQRPTWLDHHWQRTDRLTSDHDDLYRAMAGGNLGVSRNRYLDVGGFDVTFTQWGSEDTDLGHRLFLAGGLLVHEPEAACWHQGDTGGLEDHERHSLEEQRARLAQTIAHPRFRRIVPGRTYRVPWLLVEVWAGTEHPEAGTPVTEDLPTYDAVLATVEDVLASDVTDLAVHLHLPATHPDARRLGRQLAGDGRVVLEPVSDHRWSPYRIGLPAGVRLAPTSLRRLVERTGGGRLEYGLVTVHVDGLPDRTVELALARAIERARACGATTADEVRMLAEAAFGRVEVDGAEVELRWKPDSELRTIRRVRPLRLESTARTKRRSPAAPAFPAAQGAERSQVAAWQVLDSPVGWRDRGAAAEAVRAAQDAAATARRKELEVRDRLERLRERRVVQVTDAIGATVGGRATLRSLPARLRAALERAEPDVRSVTPPPAPPAGDGPEEPPAAPTSTGGRPGTAGPRDGGSQELSRDRPGRRSGSAGIGGQDRQELSRDRTRRDGMPHLRVLHLGVVSRFADLVDHVAVPAVGWQEVLRAGGDLLLIEPPPGVERWDPLHGELPRLLAAAAELGIPTVRIHAGERDIRAPGRAQLELVESVRDGISDRLAPSVDPASFHPRGRPTNAGQPVAASLTRTPAAELSGWLAAMDPAPVLLAPPDLAVATELPRSGVHRLPRAATSAPEATPGTATPTVDLRRVATAEELGAQLRAAGVLLDDPGWHASPADRWRLWCAALACGTPVVAVTEDGGDDLPRPPGVVSTTRSQANEAAERLLTDQDTRERLSIVGHRWVRRHADRRSALDAVLEAAGIPVPPAPRVTALVVTRRPELLEHALTSVARQDHPDLEISLVLHGPGFDGVDVGGRVLEQSTARLTSVLRAPEGWLLGDCLNAGLATATGDLVTKIDDDDHYGSQHVRDLVVAWRDSGADIVGKRIEFLHLADRGVTMRREPGRIEGDRKHVGGPTLTASRATLRRFGFRRLPRRVDSTLYERVLAAGGRVYATHSRDIVLTRRGGDHEHAWRIDEETLLAEAVQRWDGLNLDAAASDPDGWT